MMYPFFWGDWTYLLVLIGLVISMAASGYVNSTYAKYSQFRSKRGITGEDAARYILQQSDIQDVTVQGIRGNLTDNYNSRDKTLNLSESVGPSTSVAAIGVAAHECGHAVQDKVGYGPLKIRAALVPVANFGSMAAMPLILLGLIMGMNQTLIQIGIWCFAAAFLFQVVTLPVEFNASRRALQILDHGNMLDQEELGMARKVLAAAALTYVAAAIASLLQLLRLFLLFGNRRD